MTNVFLSHSSIDKPFIRRLSTDLRENGINVWLDEENILPGQSIVERINQALEKNDFILLAVSRSFLESEWATWETNASINKAIQDKSDSVIPLLLEDVWESVPMLLADKCYIDFRKHGNIVEYRHSLGKLTSTLLPTALPPKSNTLIPRVLVTGGRNKKFNSTAFHAAFEFGKLIGDQQCQALTGTAWGVDEYYARGVTESITAQSADPHRFLTCYYGRGRTPDHSFGMQIESMYTNREEGIPELITETDIVVLFGGGKNTHYLGVLALLEGKVVLPSAATGGAARDVHSLIRSRFEKTFGSKLPKQSFMELANTNGSASEMAARCFSLLQRIVT